ncbi:MAG: tRNA (guanosine(37)-N1)-methyltransferase TrmD [bacterium]
MRIDILTIFPRIFESPLQESMMRRARERGLVEIKVHDFREYSPDKHGRVDDYAYGGGPGMILRPEPVAAALKAILKEPGPGRTVLLSPQGSRFSQETAKEWAAENHLIIICGHYKGVDERIRERYVQEEVSIGDYVLSGGELPALVIIDAVIRLIPGVLGDLQSAEGDSFYGGLLDHPHYTRPEEFEGMRVPEVLLSGHHEHIRLWRRKEALRRTLEKRPDLLETTPLSDEERFLLEEIRAEKAMIRED